MAYVRKLGNVSFDYDGDKNPLIELPAHTETDDIECGWLGDLWGELVRLVHVHTPQKEFTAFVTGYADDFDNKFIDTTEYVEIVNGFKKCDEPRVIGSRRIQLSTQHIVACIPGYLVKRDYQYAERYTEQQYRRVVDTALYFLSPKATPVFQGKQL